MKNLCFLIISSIAIFSCSDKAVTESAKPQAVNSKGGPSTCKNDNFTYLSSIQKQNCTDLMDEKSVTTVNMELCQSKDSKQCNTVSASCNTENKCNEGAKSVYVSLKNSGKTCGCKSGEREGIADLMTWKIAKSVPVKNSSASL